MKNLTICSIFLLISTGLLAQDDFTARWNAAYELAAAKKFDQALAAFEPLLVEQPTNADTHAQMTWCYLMKGEFVEAGIRSLTGYLLDPLNASVNAVYAYQNYVTDSEKSGKYFLSNAVWFLENDEDLLILKEDVIAMKEAGLNVTSLESDLKEVMDNVDSRNRNWPKMLSKFNEAVELLNSEDIPAAKVMFNEIFPMFEGVHPIQQRNIANITYLISTHFYSVADTSYLTGFKKSYEFMGEMKSVNLVSMLHINTLMSEHFYNIGEYEKAFEYATTGLTQYSEIKNFRFLGASEAQFLSQYAASALATGNLQEGRDAGRLITELDYTGYDEWYTINGLVYMGHSWTEDEAKAQEYYRKAYNLAEANGFEDLKNGIATNFK
jgi:hypothetical protein